MSRVYNFSAGPAVLPEEVLKEAAEEMLDYRGSGMSVMEMSHRSKTFETIIEEAEANLRALMGIPDHYRVLFLQGGASQQFAMVPMNLMKNGVADYIVTGQWAKKAWKEAALYGNAKAVASSEDRTFSYIPDCSDLPIDERLDIQFRFAAYEAVLRELLRDPGLSPLQRTVLESCFLRRERPADLARRLRRLPNTITQIKKRLSKRLQARVDALCED